MKRTKDLLSFAMIAVLPSVMSLSSLQSQQPLKAEISVFASGLSRPFGLVFDKDGNLLCTVQGKYGQGGIMKLSPSSKQEVLAGPAVDDKELLETPSEEISDKIRRKYAFLMPGGIDIDIQLLDWGGLYKKQSPYDQD